MTNSKYGQVCKFQCTTTTRFLKIIVSAIMADFIPSINYIQEFSRTIDTYDKEGIRRSTEWTSKRAECLTRKIYRNNNICYKNMQVFERSFKSCLETETFFLLNEL